MRLSDEQIRETTARMMGPRELLDVLAERAIAGDPHARFSVYAAWRRQHANNRAPDA